MSDRDAELSSLLSSASLVVVGTVLGAIAKMVERIIIGRSLSLDAYGEVSIGLAILTMATTLSVLGFSQGIPRFMSRYDDTPAKRGVWVTGFVVTLGAAVVVAGALFAAAGTLTQYLGGTDSVWLLQLFFLSIPLTVGLRVGIGGLQGFENTRYRTVVQDVLHPLSRIALLVGFLWAGYGTVAAGYAYLVAAGLAFVVSHLLLNRLLPLRGSFVTRPRELLRFSLPLVVSGFLAILLSQTDTVMLGYFRPSSEVALYNAAYPIAIGLGTLLGAFNFLYLPVASRLDAQDERSEVEAIYAVTTKWAFFLTFPAFLTFAVYSGDVLAIFFGERYRDAGPALTILTVGYFSNALFGQNLRTISALGDTGYLMLINGVAYAINVVANLVLIPQYGFVGASVASAASYTAMNVAANVILWRQFRIHPFSRWSVRTFASLTLVGPPVALAVDPWVSLSLLTLVPFLAAVGIASIVVAALAGGLQSEDRVVVRYVERYVGLRVPLIRRYIPSESDDTSLLS
ncbi:flippase [Halomarina salina]|uniref:Flippase n=1 Tax=Halomarina salina TaxID=1872699 RepID=A0ABD5RIG6_9EURY|nr:flippase [Halomarina salina]